VKEGASLTILGSSVRDQKSKKHTDSVLVRWASSTVLVLTAPGTGLETIRQRESYYST
jgi:hypothetical protein